MGKRGSRNRNTNTKKKQASISENTKLGSTRPQQKLSKTDSKFSDSNDIEPTLRKILKSFLDTYRSRLSSKNDSYKADFSFLPTIKHPNLDLLLLRLANELIEDILLQVPSFPSKLSAFLLESYACIESVCTLFEKITESQSSANISKLIFFCKILKPAWEINTSLSKNQELKMIYNDFQALSSNYNDFQALSSNNKDFSLLPFESIANFLQEKKSNKIFQRLFSDTSTDESKSPNRNIDSEVEEFRNRLESCEKLTTRGKPQVSEEWINTLKRQLNKIRA
ncbi:hypothetical protein SteCoe_24266 [Stentor coeruleus]|uniref:Uncharacterized protein n=1 Tax=Stentor coeruleus TaxID=5963 RepID=A0A1R2BHV8_9CILI|nr:hypothetical protein SteCoe_24266 [Stentor coeruleus]